MKQLPTLKDCTLSFTNGVATLTFNRHDVRNALTGTAIVDDIVHVVEWVNYESSVSVLLVTGAGNVFSAGGNIKDMADKRGDFAGDEATLYIKYQQGIQRMSHALDKLLVPAIAAVNGAAIGAGFDLANMCDIRIASERAKFGETFINLGLIPGDGGAWYLQRLIGYQKAAELTYTGKMINAQQALDYGVVLRIVPHESLLNEALQLANEIAEKPAYAIRATKRLMKLAPNMPLTPFLEACAKEQAHCHHQPEHMEAVKVQLSNIEK